MANEQKTSSAVPITVLPPGSGDQIDQQRKWEVQSARIRGQSWTAKRAGSCLNELPRGTRESERPTVFVPAVQKTQGAAAEPVAGGEMLAATIFPLTRIELMIAAIK